MFFNFPTHPFSKGKKKNHPMQRVLASLRQGPALRNRSWPLVSFVARNQFSPRQREPLILVQYTEGGSCPLLQSKNTTRANWERQTTIGVLSFSHWTRSQGLRTDNCSVARMNIVIAYQLLALLFAKNTSATPIIPLPRPATDASLPADWCQLYPEVDGGGTLQFLEDCNSTER